MGVRTSRFGRSRSLTMRKSIRHRLLRRCRRRSRGLRGSPIAVDETRERGERTAVWHSACRSSVTTCVCSSIITTQSSCELLQAKSEAARFDYDPRHSMQMNECFAAADVYSEDLKRLVDDACAWLPILTPLGGGQQKRIPIHRSARGINPYARKSSFITRAGLYDSARFFPQSPIFWRRLGSRTSRRIACAAASTSPTLNKTPASFEPM